MEVKDISKEDHLAKTFNRPEWKKLVAKTKAKETHKVQPADIRHTGQTLTSDNPQVKSY